jgi:hypothetical protein
MGGSAMQDTAIVSLTTTRMLRDGFVPSMLMLTWDFVTSRGIWQINFDLLQNVTGVSPTSSTRGRLHLDGVAYDGEGFLEILMTITYT